ncbi:MAG: hypothetical protein RR351_00015 [Christensenella sp.]
MFGHIGFSYVGLIYLLLLLAPNIVWRNTLPPDYDSGEENNILLLLERVGQVGCAVVVLMFGDFNFAPFSAWSVWIILSFVMIGIYELCWFRYFKSAHTNKNFYRDFYKIPVPMAVFPVAAFVLLGIYGKVIWLIIFAALLGVGHIGIHLAHAKNAGV